MNARGSSSTISKRAGSRLAAACAPGASGIPRGAAPPPVSPPTRIRGVGAPEFLLNLRPWAGSHAPGRLARSSRQTRSSLVSFGGSQSPAFGQETRPRRVGSLLPAEPLVARLIWWLPLAHELDLGDEAHAEAAFDLGLTELHQDSDIVGARVAGVDDDVRVLLAAQRAAAPLAFEASRFDQTPGVVSRWIAEDRAGVGLRQGLLLHAFIRHLFDAPNGSRAIAGGAAEARAHTDGRCALKLARAVGVAELVGRDPPRLAVQVHQLGVDEHVGGLAAEGAGVPVHRSAHCARHRRHPLEADDPGLRGDSRHVRELRPRGRPNRRAFHASLPPAVVEHEAADAVVGDEQVGTTAHHEDRQLVFSRDLDRADEILLRRHAHEIVRGTADAERGVWREPLTPRSQGAYAHAVARSRRSSRSRSPAGRMSPAPRTSTRSPERAFSASTRAAAAPSAAYAPPARDASERASARSSRRSRAEANVSATTRTSAVRKASAKSSKNARSRLGVCGWNSTTTRPDVRARTASMDARISAGW